VEIEEQQEERKSLRVLLRFFQLMLTFGSNCINIIRKNKNFTKDLEDSYGFDSRGEERRGILQKEIKKKNNAKN
jgi:hypothetical protein